MEIDRASPGMHGGLRGSYPITGGYMTLRAINWGTKFFIDALLDERECLELRESFISRPQQSAISELVASAR